MAEFTLIHSPPATVPDRGIAASDLNTAPSHRRRAPTGETSTIRLVPHDGDAANGFPFAWQHEVNVNRVNVNRVVDSAQQPAVYEVADTSNTTYQRRFGDLDDTEEEEPRPGVVLEVFEPLRLPLVAGDAGVDHGVDVLIKRKPNSLKELDCYECFGPHRSICPFWRLWRICEGHRLVPELAVQLGTCSLLELMSREPRWVRDNIKRIARQCFDGLRWCHSCGRNAGDFKSSNVVCFADAVYGWWMALIDFEDSQRLEETLDPTYFTTPGHVPTHRPATPMAYDWWAFRTFLLQLVTYERFNFNGLWCAEHTDIFGTQDDPKDPVVGLLEYYSISMEALVPHDEELRRILVPGRIIQENWQAEKFSSEISGWLDH